MASIPPKGIEAEQHSYLECLAENRHRWKGEHMIHQVNHFVRQNALLLIVLALIAGGYFFLRTSPRARAFWSSPWSMGWRESWETACKSFA